MKVNFDNNINLLILIKNIMIETTVILSFIVCIFFNIFLNSFDVYSDTSLTYNTLTFNLGDSVFLTGCKLCYGKDDQDILLKNMQSCSYCVTKNHHFQCGLNYGILNYIDKLKNVEKCDVQENFSALLVSDNFYFENRPCNYSADSCCIETNKKTELSSPFKDIDRKLIAYHISQLGYNRSSLDYDIYVLGGRHNTWHCRVVFLDYFGESDSRLRYFLDKNITNAAIQKKREWYFKFVTIGENNVSLEEGFQFQDDCGIFIQEKQTNWVYNNGERVCGLDSCFIHLQRLNFVSNVSSLSQWKQKTFYQAVIELGGQKCHLLRQLGLVGLAPILLNLIFNIHVFLEDIKLGKAWKMEFVFVFALFYPQWRTLHFLFEYLCDRNETNLNAAKDDYDKRIGTLEPFLESAFQVI